MLIMGEIGGMEKFRKMVSSSPDLAARAFSSVFIVFVLIGGIIAGGLVWNAIVMVLALISLWEFYKLLSVKFDISPWLIMISGAAILLTTALQAKRTLTLSAISLVAFVALFLEVLRRQVSGVSYALQNMGVTVAGIAYVALPWSFMMTMRTRELGAVFLITLFFCTWSCDVAAYLVGGRFGNNLLCSRVSPKKTWEGFLGGAVASFFCGGLLALIFYFPPLPLLLMGLLCGIAGQIGDLGESVLKREAGVKDSGSIIPGHGGLLDRFDSILVNSTLAFLIFELVG